MSRWAVGRLDVYHRLPPSVRNLVASGRGHYLRRWRYGPETDSLVAAALSRESWTADQWLEFRRAKLLAILGRAAKTVPYYRDDWARLGRKDGSLELRDWPVLKKEALRQSGRRFLAADSKSRRMFREQTSGTTGKPLELWWSRGVVRAWYALFEARVRLWNGVSRTDRWGMLGGQLITPPQQRQPPFWVWNSGLRQLYLSSYHLAPATVESYIDALRRYAVSYLFGYASSLDSLAQMALERGLKAPRMRVAISNAEPLLDHQRERIARVFDCPVRDTYGMAEIVCAGSECEAAVMHEWPEVGWIEVLRDDADVPVQSGEVGRIVATGLLNPDMPLIRYETGDRGALQDGDVTCSCGRRLPRLRRIEGRADDVLVLADGRRIGRLDPVFKGGSGVREAQIIQEAVGRLRVLIVRAEGSEALDLKGLEVALRRRVGDAIEIEFETIERIPRSSAGKFRAVISRVAGT